MKTLTALLVFIGLSISSFAQGGFDFFNGEEYTDRPSHLEIGVGVTNFLGDLGGKDGAGTNDFRDLEFTEFNFGAMVGYRHCIIKNLYGRANFAYGRVSGSDQLTNEAFRRNRNLSFRSDIFEFDLMAEGWLLISGKKGHQYKIERVGKERAPWRVHGMYMTGFIGIGLFHFNPKAEFQGQWVELRPLRTEGQGLANGPKEYKLTQFNIPVGASFMFRMHKKWCVGIEAMYRFTWTDYIDDVSTVYYDPNEIALYADSPQMGEVAAYLSNPSLGPANGGLSPNVTAVGAQRGDSKDDDGYLYVMIKVDYWMADRAKKFRSGARSKTKARRRGTFMRSSRR